MSESNNTHSDEQVSQFLAFTGTVDTSQATSYLEMSGGDLQTAVDLFLEHSSAPAAGGGTGTSSGSGTGGTNNSSSSMVAGGEVGDDVRAPDATRTMRLMDFEDGTTGGSGSHSQMDIPGILARAAHASSANEAHFHAAVFGPSVSTGGVSDSNRGSAARSRYMYNAFADDLNSNEDDNDDVLPMGGLGSSGDDGNGMIPGSFRDVINRAAAMESSSSNNNNFDTVAEAGSNDDGEDMDEDGDDDIVIVDSDDAAETMESTTSSSTRNNISGSRSASSRSVIGSSRARSLGDMFEAPISLIYDNGGFQGARSMAKESKRWLLVNIQCDSDFACHTLNRDVWRDEFVENLVREGFIFWQSTNSTPDGQVYSQRYNVTGYPHVAIIDPRTGRLMWKKEGWTAQNPMTPAMFAETATDFCSRHSFDRDPSIPFTSSSTLSRLGSAPTGTLGVDIVNNSSSNNVMRSVTNSTADMTEEEQLEAAIRASMNERNGGIDIDENNDNGMGVSSVAATTGDEVCIDDQMLQTKPTASSQVPKEEVEEEDRPATFQEEITSMEVGDEPSSTTGVAKIMIRMPDGKRLVRKFSSDDTVKTIYAFVAQSNDDAKSGKAFECKAGFPPKDLQTSVDETIGKSGLAGDTITVRWKN